MASRRGKQRSSLCSINKSHTTTVVVRGSSSCKRRICAKPLARQRCALGNSWIEFGHLKWVSNDTLRERMEELRLRNYSTSDRRSELLKESIEHDKGRTSLDESGGYSDSQGAFPIRKLLIIKDYGGETGIRTLDTLRYTRFPSVRLQPLGHLSAAISRFFESTTVTALS